EASARALLDRVVEERMDAGSGDLHFYLFARALSKRLASQKTEEIILYLRQFQDTQISLFNLLARHLPTVQLTAPLANQLLARLVREPEEETLAHLRSRFA